MASQKISAMPLASLPLVGDEWFPLIQDDTNKKIRSDGIGLPGAADGIIAKIAGSIASNALFFTDGAGNVTILGQASVGVLAAGQILEPPSLDARQVVFSDGTLLTGSDDLKFLLTGVLEVKLLNVIQGFGSDGNSIFSDGAGSLTAEELHAANGFSGTGTFSNFTIVDGVITGAT